MRAQPWTCVLTALLGVVAGHLERRDDRICKVVVTESYGDFVWIPVATSVSDHLEPWLEWVPSTTSSTSTPTSKRPWKSSTHAPSVATLTVPIKDSSRGNSGVTLSNGRPAWKPWLGGSHQTAKTTSTSVLDGQKPWLDWSQTLKTTIVAITSPTSGGQWQSQTHSSSTPRQTSSSWSPVNTGTSSSSYEYTHSTYSHSWSRASAASSTSLPDTSNTSHIYSTTASSTGTSDTPQTTTPTMTTVSTTTTESTTTTTTTTTSTSTPTPSSCAVEGFNMAAPVFAYYDSTGVPIDYAFCRKWCIDQDIGAVSVGYGVDIGPDDYSCACYGQNVESYVARSQSGYFFSDITCPVAP